MLSKGNKDAAKEMEIAFKDILSGFLFIDVFLC
jgi:hypothetical protein